MLSRWNIESHLNVRSVISAAKSEQSDNPMMGWAEKLLWGLYSPDRHDYFHFLSKNLWTVETNGFCIMQTYIRLFCCIEMLTFRKIIAWYANESGCTFTWRELDKPKEFTAPWHSTSSRAERFDIVLVLPESCFTPEYVAYSLRGCSQPSFPLRKAVQKSTLVVGQLRTSSKLTLESWHSQRLKSTDSASCKPTSDCYAVLRCWHLEKDCLVCQWIWLYFHLKNIG